MKVAECVYSIGTPRDVDLCADRIEVPSLLGRLVQPLGPTLLDLLYYQRSGLASPVPHCLMADVHPALMARRSTLRSDSGTRMYFVTVRRIS